MNHAVYRLGHLKIMLLMNSEICFRMMTALTI